MYDSVIRMFRELTSYYLNESTKLVHLQNIFSNYFELSRNSEFYIFSILIIGAKQICKYL